MFFIKNVLINFNSSPVTSDFNLGMTGEHNAAQLVITPPENLSSDERTSHYRIAFFSANKTYLSEAKTGESFAVALSSAVTKNPSLDIQLIAYDDEGEFIGKSERINGFGFEPSIAGTAVEIGGENGDIANEIVKISDSLDTIQSSLAGEIARASEKENLLDREKVDKVSGKGLSANDFTDSEKQKLASLENYNDSGILARLAYAEDDITSLETGKVDKVSGKGLSTNDFTNSEREKLASLHGRMFFGTCSSAAIASTKEVSTDAGFSLTQGVIIVVSFANASGGDNLSPRYLNVNSSGAKRIANTNSPFLDSWQPFDANSVITFVYCGDRWIQTDCYYADSTDFGQVKLSDSLSENKDSSWHIAASAKAAYDLEHKKVDKPSSLIPANYVPKSDGMGGYSWQEEYGGDLSYITHITWNENTPEYSSGYDWNALLEAYESGKKVGIYDDDNNVLAWFNDFSDGLAVTIILDEPAPARAHIVNLSFKSTGIEIINYRPVLTPEDVPEDAEGISYDNTESGLEAVTVQGAIDEVADDLGGKLDTPTGGSAGDVLKKTADGEVWDALSYLSLDDRPNIDSSKLILESVIDTSVEISELNLGDIIKIPENINSQVTLQDYIIVSKNNEGVVVLRDKSLGQLFSPFDGTSRDADYPNNRTGIYISNTFSQRFSEGILANVLEKTYSYEYQSNSNYYVHSTKTTTAKIILPSKSDFETNFIDALKIAKNTSDNNTARICYKDTVDGPVAVSYWTRDAGGYSDRARVYNVNSTGSIGRNGTWGDTTHDMRPMMTLLLDSKIDGNNTLKSRTVPVYAGDIDTVQKEFSLFRIKDADARAAIENIKDGTNIESFADVETALDEKQDALTAGEGISIVDNVISASSPSIPSGTNNGDILVWDASQNKYISKPKWQMIYQPVEYIEGTGSQWINTGVIPDGTTSFEIDVQFSNITNQFMGISQAGEITNTRLALGINNDDNDTSEYHWYFAISEANNMYSSPDLDRHKLKIDLAAKKGYFDDVEVCSADQQLGTFTDTVVLFARNPEKDFKCSCKLYGSVIGKGNNVVRAFIPVRNIIDGSIGLYETVEGKFYGNNGSGTFLKGADVNA